MKTLSPILDKLNLKHHQYLPYGHNKAKIIPETLNQNHQGKLILVTALSPTPSGEGKTTISTGLSDAFNAQGENVVLSLREPSMGPCFGFKGGATGGGKASLYPAKDINMHFTGDFHAITAAHNLLSALLDNHLYRGNGLNINPNHVFWNRVLDMNDRALREVVIGLGKANGLTRESSFDITPASEIMAILCLASDFQDLIRRLGQIELGLNFNKGSVRARDLSAENMLALLLESALHPNLVQTLEETPTLVHGGPFANIAHGCNSVISTHTALKLADYVVTEAGFGADLGAEKFFNIKCRQSGIRPDAVVVVATLKALKYHGGASLKSLKEENLNAIREGFLNLVRHYENIRHFGYSPIVAINQFASDTPREIELLQSLCAEQGYKVTVANVFEKGGQGALELAHLAKSACASSGTLNFTYSNEASFEEKINALCQKVYKASSVQLASSAKRQLKRIEKMGLGHLPICMAKTQYSFSDQPGALGAPTDFEFNIRDAKLSAGAEFVVLYAGEILTMPGLPKSPQPKFPLDS